MKIKKLSALTLSFIILAGSLPAQAMNDKDLKIEEKQVQNEVQIESEVTEDSNQDQNMETLILNENLLIKFYEGEILLGTKSVTKNYKISEPTDLSRYGYGYVFEGWYTDKDLTQQYSFKDPITENLSLYGKWTKQPSINNIYTVCFMLDNGHVQQTSVAVGSKVKKPTDPIKDGYKFTGWCIEQSLIPFDFDQTITKGGRIKLFPTWVKNEGCTITFNTNGGSNINQLVIQKGKIITKPEDPTKTGFTFGGWYSDSKLEKLYDFKNITNNDLILYAKWTKSDFKITFNTDGAGLIEPQNIIKGNQLIKPSDPSKSGYIFNGWYINPEKTILFNFTTPIEKDTTLYAKWAKIGTICTVSFVYDNGKVEKQSVAIGSKIIKPADPVKDGYKFISWNSFPSSSPFDFNKTITKAGDIKLTCSWERKNYIISFNTNGGNKISPISFLSTKNVIEPTKAGYVFKGWYLDSSLKVPFSLSNKTKITSNITLYAKWEQAKPSYMIYFETNGGDLMSPIDSSSLKNSIKPTKTGYIFAGWYLDENLTKPFILNTTQITSTTILYAKWSKEVIIKKTFDIYCIHDDGKIEKQSVAIGLTARKPVDPTRLGYRFIGWYSSFSSIPFDFNKPIIKGGEISLSPMWVKATDKSYTVSFNTNGGTPIKSIEVLNGQGVPCPPKPVKNGYLFDGWYTNSEWNSNSKYKNPYNFSGPLSQNMTLNAKWVKIL